MSTQQDYSRKAAAERLSVSVQTLDRLIESGEVRSYRVRRRVLVPAEELDRFLARCRGADLAIGTGNDTKEIE